MNSAVNMIASDVVPDEAGVWVLRNHQRFAYSDGAASERYLAGVLAGASDLTTGSGELQRLIVDWPSEYHLSPKRAQLLTGFEFDRSARVLEVGGGCGAITRFLGETFAEVVSIEGSHARARLARTRTRDLPGVTIVCAPFQDVCFRHKFDLIFCIGVYEYSASFVDAEDPYDAVLRHFDGLLSANGTVVIAIENQFGLKYFNSSREDHLGRRYAGIQGYTEGRVKVRTFGRGELRKKLSAHFPSVEFLYPYPDYKLPDCVLREEFLASGEAVELVSQMRSRDYLGSSIGLWDESLVLPELSRNGLLPDFSNSFLVMASKGEPRFYDFRQQGVVYTAGRARSFRTITRLTDERGSYRVSKMLASGQASARSGSFVLNPSDSTWQRGGSLQASLYSRCRNLDATLGEIFEPCLRWLDDLREHSFDSSTGATVPGSFLDATWGNYYLGRERGTFVDLEWIFDRDLPLNVIVIRAIYVFLRRLGSGNRLNRALRVRRGRELISRIARCLGIRLTSADFRQFLELESEFQARAFESNPRRNRLLLSWFLVDAKSVEATLRQRHRAAEFVARIRNRLLSLSG